MARRKDGEILKPSLKRKLWYIKAMLERNGIYTEDYGRGTVWRMAPELGDGVVVVGAQAYPSVQKAIEEVGP
jgi:hypothetical protein